MKVKLEIELEVPDSWKEWSHAELSINLYEQFITRARQHHMHQLMYTYNFNYDPAARAAIMAHHEEWAGITKEPRWKIVSND